MIAANFLIQKFDLGFTHHGCYRSFSSNGEERKFKFSKLFSLHEGHYSD